MTLNEYQKAAKEFAFYPQFGRNLGYAALGLAGEAGEVANEVKKYYRDDDGKLSPERRNKIKDEMSDVLWYLAALAEEAQLDLETIAYFNIAKLQQRRKESGR